MTPLIPALLAGLAVAVLIDQAPTRGLGRAWSMAASRRSPPEEEGNRSPTPAGSPRALGLVLGVLWAMLFPSGPGLVAAAVIGVGLPLSVSAHAANQRRAADRRIQAEAPEVLALLVACLAAGGSLPESTAAVGDAGVGELHRILRGVSAAMRLGASPDAAWLRVKDIPGLEAAVSAIVRSERTGAPLAESLLGVVAEARRHRAEVAMVSARSAGVRAVLPLGLCFLPAFVLVGVIPVVASLLPALF